LTEVDRLFTQARLGDVKSFEQWMGSVELPIRLSLRRFARVVDAESVVQETLLRMWVLANDAERTLEGENASLRFALGVARNLARAEARKAGRQVTLPPEDLPEIPVEPAPPSSPALRKKILDCIAKLAQQPRAALTARLRMGGVLSDQALAVRLRMTRNTFLQNITRARKQVTTCLEREGVSLREVLA
jgi:DNA-directed RNA polymerase specialized sigma24 family protein